MLCDGYRCLTASIALVFVAYVWAWRYGPQIVVVWPPHSVSGHIYYCGGTRVLRDTSGALYDVLVGYARYSLWLSLPRCFETLKAFTPSRILIN